MDVYSGIHRSSRKMTLHDIDRPNCYCFSKYMNIHFIYKNKFLQISKKVNIKYNLLKDSNVIIIAYISDL